MKLAAALLLVAIVAASSTSAEALSIVEAEATLNWTGFTFTTTGTLAAKRIDGPEVQVSTSAPTTPTTPTGSATADASAVNGFLTANATAETIADGGLPHVGEGSAVVTETFWFTGTGSGSLVVTLPYHLELTSVETGDRDITSASASVSFFTGPGVGSNDDWFVSDTISLAGAGTLSRDGVLTASRHLSNSSFGPLVVLGGQAEVRVSSAVPETGSLVLLTLGLLVIGVQLAWQWRRDSRAATSRH